MQSGMDPEATVTPHQLCARCTEIIEIYTQKRFWTSEEKVYDASSSEALDSSSESSETVPRLRYHDSLLHLRESADNGCHLCSLFLGSRKRDQQAHKDGTVYVQYAFDQTKRSSCQGKMLMIELEDDSQEPFGYISMHRHDPDEGEVACTEGLDSTPDGSIESEVEWTTTQKSPATFKMLKSWLERCTDQHETCRYDLSSKQPARVLDLDAFPSSRDIRLVHTDEIDVSTYATLSYCWGTTNYFVLNEANHNNLRSRIKFDDLPKTIRDSIDVCRGMSVRYLWIDALCIIQEDSADFNSEIANMGSIFAGSIFTIAATESSNSESGCFGGGWPLQRKSCILKESENIRWVMGPTTTTCYSHRLALGSMHLNQRGWVLQERLLSPRTIHFTRSEIVWECREQIFCQDCVKGVSNSALEMKEMQSEVYWYEGKRGVLNLHQGWKQADHELRFRRVWADILHPYSTTDFTNIDDRLSALAGLAQFVRSQASYGLWIDEFIEELQWYTLAGRGRFEKICNLTPTWSWLSIRDFRTNGENLCGDDYRNHILKHTKSYRTLLSAKMTKYAPATPFQQISALYERLPQPVSFSIRGMINPCQLMPSRRQFDWAWTLVPTETHDEMKLAMLHAWRAFLHNEEEEIWRLDTMDYRAENHAAATASVLGYYPDINLVERGQILHCLLLKRELRIDTLFDTGIVLQQLDPTRRLFKRVGYFREFIQSKRRTNSSGHDTEELADADDISGMISKFKMFNGAGAEVEAEIEII